MPRISSSSRIESKAGFTLLEILIVITVMALTVAIVLPNVRRSLSESAVQTTFLEFQSHATSLRARAYHENQAINLLATAEAPLDDADVTDDPASSEVRTRSIHLNDPSWSYRLAEPMTISAGGVCSQVDAYLYQDDKQAAHLQSQADCHFKRVTG